MPDDVVNKVPEVDKLSWAERHGGWMLSLCIHLVVFAFFLNHFVARNAGVPQVQGTARAGKVNLRMARPTPSGEMPVPNTFEPGFANGKNEGGRMKDEGGGGKDEGGRMKDEGGGRKYEGGRMKDVGSGGLPISPILSNQSQPTQQPTDRSQQPNNQLQQSGPDGSLTPHQADNQSQQPGNQSAQPGSTSSPTPNSQSQQNNQSQQANNQSQQPPSSQPSPNPSPGATPPATQNDGGGKFVQTESGEFVRERPVKEIYVPEVKESPKVAEVKPPDDKAKVIEELDGLDKQAKAKEQDRRVAQILQDYKQQEVEGRKSLNEHRTDIKGRLQTAEIAAAAFKAFPEYGGARVGAVRTLDFTKVDEKAAKLVMDKYAIQIRTKYVDSLGPSYLNSAASGGTVYTTTNKPGMYEVFEISAKAYKQMIWLEQDYLSTHGYSPKTCRIDSVEFGIVQKGSDWDLGILDIKVQQLAEIGKPKIEAQAPASPRANE